MRRIRSAVICACLLIVASLFVPDAFPQVGTADIIGTLTDSSSAVLPNATVTAKNMDTNLTRTQQSGASGDYAFTLLPIGNYSVTMEANGFKMFSAPRITLATGDRRRVDAQMEVGAVSPSCVSDGRLHEIKGAPVYTAFPRPTAKEVYNHAVVRSRLEKTMASALAIPTFLLAISFNHTPQLSAQSAPVSVNSPTFDAASIKLGRVPIGRQGADGGGIVQIDPARGVVFSRSGTVRRMILAAYDLMPAQLSGGPAWLDSDWFVLDAKAEGPASANQLRQMLQKLLAERCRLVAHRDTKQMLVYAVTVAKNGPRLHEIGEDDPEPTQMISRERAIELWGSRDADALAHWGGVSDLQEFLHSLPNIVSIDGSGVHPIDRPVLDKTGLSGHYWIQVGWDSDEDFIPAIQDELGLKFESQKAPVAVLVIDHVEKPTPN